MGLKLFEPYQVLELLGYSCSSLHSINIPCYSCDRGGQGKHLNVNLDKGVYNCFKCPDVQGTVVKLYQEMKGFSSFEEAFSNLLEELGYDIPQGQKHKHIKPTQKAKVIPEASALSATTPLASESDRDKVYSALIKMLPLEEKHFDELLRRGLTPAAIYQNSYASMPNEQQFASIVKKLVSSGINLKNVPGFYKENGEWKMNKLFGSLHFSGIMIPYRNHNGKIQAIQVRVDESEREKWKSYFQSKGRKDVPKYLLWSSYSNNKNHILEDGARVETFVHHACDFILRDDYIETGNMAINFHEKKGIVLTEGGLKADIFHCLSGFPAIAIPGVSCTTHLEKALRILRESYGIDTVYDALDMDGLENPNVKRAVLKNRDLILKHGMQYKKVVWPNNDHSAKGIDDYYVLKYLKN